MGARLRRSGSKKEAPAGCPAPLVAALLLLAWLPGCAFDDGALQALRCGEGGGGCGDGAVCCGGFCLPDAGCVVPDLVPWPDLGGPDLSSTQDSDGDKVPDVSDCAPTNPWFKKTAVDLRVFTDPAPFSPVEAAADWKVQQGVYVQTNPDGLRRSASSVAGVTDASASVKIRLLATGDDGLTAPAQGLAMAGLVLRTAGLGPAKGSGYYCAVDQASGRLQLGKTVAGDLAAGKMTLFADPTADGGVAGTPGKPVSGGVPLKLPFILTLNLRKDSLTCRAVLPSQSMQAELTHQDASLASGGFALFSAGASVQFETASLCVP